MQQITRKLMITLVLLMTAAAGAWATIYTGPVAITSLQVGDILAPGFSLTGDNSNYIHFDGGRHKYGGTPSTEETTKRLGDIVSINTLCVIKTNDNKEITPSDENENDVYAWKVTQVSSSGIWLSGIYYPAAIPTANANEWSMVMPVGNVLLTVAYKDRATMALTYGGTAITTEANAVTVFKGCEQEFAEALTPAVQNIEPTFNSGTAQDVTTTLAADFTFKSSDAGIIGFKTGETYADEGTLDQMEFRALTTTPVTLTVTYKGTDDLESKSQALLVTIEKKTYAITLAEGTEEFDKWAISPAEATKGSTITAKYSGEKKVKSVKAVKKEVIKPDLLSGVFSVSASKKVNFSKGNLQATYDGSSWTWAFANNQWDYIGNAAGNTKVTDASPFISENGTVDLFGWVGASSTWDGVNQYGITSSKARNATNGYGNSATENLKNDWGTLMGTGWRTLTKDEWAYMLNSRSGTRYCNAQVNSKSGLVIFPDGYTHPTGPTAPTNTNTTNVAYTTNSWSGEAWTKMENAGCVFLPAAGSRDGNSVSYAGTAGTYWWSTHYEGGGDAVDRAYNLYFTNNYLLPTAGSYRDMGCSVRLVREVTE